MNNTKKTKKRTKISPRLIKKNASVDSSSDKKLENTRQYIWDQVQKAFNGNYGYQQTSEQFQKVCTSRSFSRYKNAIINDPSHNPTSISFKKQGLVSQVTKLKIAQKACDMNLERDELQEREAVRMM